MLSTHRSTAFPNPFTLLPNQSREIYVPNVPAAQLPTGRYSVVISSTEKIVAIASVAGTGTRRFSGSYSGFESGASPVYLPAVYYNYFGWYSMISVQNLGASPTDLADITVTITCSNGTVGTLTANDVPQHASATFALKNTIPSGFSLSTVCNGSAAVTANQPVAVTDNQSKPAVGNTQSYGGLASGNSKIYVPTLFFNYFGWYSSLGIRKLGSGTTTVTVTYSDSGSSQCVLTNAEPSCLLLYVATSTAHPGSGTFGATITSSPAMQLVAVANTTKGTLSASYTGIGDGESTDKVAIPSVFKYYFGWISSFTCQNVSPAGSTQLRITYDGESPYTHSTVLGPGAQVEVKVFEESILPATGYIGGVVVESTNTSVDISCTVGHNNPSKLSTIPGDWAQRYNAFSK